MVLPSPPCNSTTNASSHCPFVHLSQNRLCASPTLPLAHRGHVYPRDFCRHSHADHRGEEVGCLPGRAVQAEAHVDVVIPTKLHFASLFHPSCSSGPAPVPDAAPAPAVAPAGHGQILLQVRGGCDRKSLGTTVLNADVQPFVSLTSSLQSGVIPLYRD